MGHAKVPVGGRDGIGMVVLRQNQEAGGERDELPHEQERQRIVGHDLEAHGEHQEVDQPVGAATSGRGGVAQVAEPIEPGGQGDQSDDDEEEGPERVEVEPERPEEEPRNRGDGRREAGDHGASEDQTGGCADRRGNRRHCPAKSARGQQRNQRGAGIGADEHGQEEFCEAHAGSSREGAAGPRRSGGFGNRPSAARMPRRMSAGSGGHPSIHASTGITASTLPATA